jgi:peroxiredoxin
MSKVKIPGSKANGSLFILGLLIGISLAVLIWIGFGPMKVWNRLLRRSPESILAPAQGQPAPDFTLQSIDGKKVQLSDFKGKNVILNFWATWCTPCKLEMPLLQQSADENSSDLVVLAINYDESEAEVNQFIDELGLRLDVLYDPGGKINREYRVLGYPTSIFIDKSGKIQFRHMGILSEGQITRYMQKLEEIKQ